MRTGFKIISFGCEIHSVLPILTLQLLETYQHFAVYSRMTALARCLFTQVTASLAGQKLFGWL